VGLTGTAAHVTRKGYLQPNAIVMGIWFVGFGCHPRGFEMLDRKAARAMGIAIGSWRGATDVLGFSSSSPAALASRQEQISDVTISFATAFEE
jgi:hypothetical protein